MINWKRLLTHRRENYQVNNGLKAGVLIGVLNAIYGAVAMILAKEKLIQILAAGINEAKLGIEAESAYLLSLVITPIANLVLLLIFGVIFGILSEKFHQLDNWWISVISVGLGITWGVLLNTGVSQFVNVIAGTLSGLIFAVTFIFLSLVEPKAEEKE